MSQLKNKIFLGQSVIIPFNNQKINKHEDMISSLSSGITNTTKDVFKVGIVLISYAWLVDKVTVYKLDPLF